MPEVWHFYVGFRSLPQKNCTIWTLSKGYGIWIAPYSLFFLYRQIVQPKPKTKNCINNVMAKSHLRSFVMPFFISSLLYTIFAALRSFLECKKMIQAPECVSLSDIHSGACFLFNSPPAVHGTTFNMIDCPPLHGPAYLFITKPFFSSSADGKHP